MLSFVQLDKPHIDIELYGTDTNIAPIDKVHIMDEDSFEQFTLEWLFGCKSRSIPQLKELEVLEIRVEMLLVIIVMVL